MEKNFTLRSKSNIKKKHKGYILLLIKKGISLHLKKPRKKNSVKKKKKIISEIY